MTEPTAQLYLLTPSPDADQPLTPRLEAALAGGDVACVLITGSAALPERELAALIRMVQARGAAALLAGDAALAARLDADGVHVDDPGALTGAVRRSKPDRIVGAGRLPTRDDAMAAGESGVDYVLLGDEAGVPFADRLDRVAWWAEIFQVPCVALARHADEIVHLAETGAEFIGLGDVVWSDPDGPQAAVAKARQAMATGHAAFLARQAEPA